MPDEGPGRAIPALPFLYDVQPAASLGYSYRFDSEMTARTTIFALSSGPLPAGIAVVRLSGPAAGMTLDALATPRPEPRRASLCRLTGPDDGLPIDEALVLWLPGPDTATGEDMAEFHLHGSAAVVERLTAALMALPGMALAEPGEFTRRAFANGRMDLAQVEGLSDLLAAQTARQHQQALRLFSGRASSVFEGWRQQIIAAEASLTAAIDFSDEEDVGSRALADLHPRLISLIETLTAALAQAARAGSVRDGVKVVFAGVPNAGKSSLLNRLALRDVAIVSPEAGTTRDVIEVPVSLAGYRVILTDTAGLRDFPEGPMVEQEGMRRARAEAAAADLVIWVTAPDMEPGEPPVARPDLVLLNKADLLSGPTESIRTRNGESYPPDLAVSAKSGAGLELLLARLTTMISTRMMGAEEAVVLRARHVAAVEKTIRFLNDAIRAEKMGLEVMAEALREASRSLASLTGRVDVEDVLGQIFSEFCIGK
jgi:tRNA modification GTPase